ncbi:hypothetical protein GFY24_13045 [Nocardia sp. SYP-A9097]|uniref:hypothetical protein n=1 Tax=Nocardia sp. SYP-A9097 TaxID=2663237 RepID=UPI00129A84DE|nr:hypothetical protein [Nocardia sp. SYP-A9097]MRH88359.1 hypothetical protein [Nocardia sp. SYP-A9097]
MKFMMGCALAVVACTTTGLPAAQADTTPTCIESDNGYKAEWQASWAIYQAEQGNSTDSRSSIVVDLPITIAAPLQQVWSVYSNLHNDIGRHPFLKDVITHRTCDDAGTQVSDFTALEDIPMGPITFPGHTQAEQRLHPAEHYYTSDSWDIPNITTHQLITFIDNGDGTTTVNEHITFLADPTLLQFTADNGAASHRAYQAALKRDIENGSLTTTR